MVNNALSLLIDTRVNGTPDIGKLESAIAGLSGSVDKLTKKLSEAGEQSDEHAKKLKKHGDAAEEASEKIKKLGESIKHGIESPLSAGNSVLDKFGEKLGVGGVAAATFTGTVLAIGVAAFESMHMLGELGTHINNVSIKTGLSTQEVSLFSFAAKAAGSDIGAFETAMRMLSRGLSDNTEEGKKSRKALSDIGIEAKDLHGNLMPMSDIFLQISDRMEEMKSVAERNTLAVEIFGKSGIELVPVLMKLRENLDFAKTAGIEVFSKEQIEHMEEYHKNVLLIEDAFGKVKHAIAAALAEALRFFMVVPEAEEVPYRLRKRVELPPEESEPDSTALKAAGATRGGFSSGLTFRGMNPNDPFGAALLEQQSVAAGASRIARAEALHERTPEGARERLTQAEEAEKKAHAAFLGARGQVDENVKPLEEAWKKATAEVTKYKAIVDAMKEAPRDIHVMQEFLDRLANKEVTPVERVFQQRDQFLRDHGKSLTAGQRGEVGDATIMAANDALRKMQSKDAEEGVKRQDFYVKEVAKSWDEVYKGLERYDNLVIRDLKNLEKEAAIVRDIRNIELQSGREGIIGRANKTLRLSELGAAPGNEGQIDATNRAYSVRLQLAEELRALDLDTAYREADLGKQRIDIAKAEADYQKQSQDAAIERELRLAEIQKKRVDDFRALSVDFVNAIEQHTVSSFFKQQGQKLQNEVVGNAAEMAFKFLPNLSLTSDPNSFMGKLLAGTPFGAKAKSPEALATELNTQATELNTQALIQLGGGSTAPNIGGTLSGTVGTIAKSLGLSIPGLNTNGGAFESGGMAMGGAGSTIGRSIAVDSSWTSRSVAGPMFDSNASTGSRVAGGIAAAGTAYAGTMAAIHDFKSGGARGIIGGIGDIAGTAAAFDPEPISRSILMGIALGSQLIKSIFGDPKQIRQNDINKRLAADQFYSPVAINASMDTRGSAVGTDRYGNLMSLDNSPYPQVQQPYADLRNGITVPGRTVNPIGGPSGVNPGPTTVNVHITAMDGTDVKRVLDHNLSAVGDAMHAAVLAGHGDGFVRAMRER